MMHFENERLTVEHGSLRKKVDRMLGWRCKECGVIGFDQESAIRYATTGDELVLKSSSKDPGS